MSDSILNIGPGQRHAVLIGCNHAPQSGMMALQSPEAELARLAALLGDPQTCAFKVLPLLGAAAQRDVVMATLAALTQRLGADDTLIVVWSGHGVPWPHDGFTDLALITHDTEPDLATALSAAWLSERVFHHAQIGHVLLILNCCYAATALTQPELTTLFQTSDPTRTAAKTRWVMAAAHAQHTALEVGSESVFLRLVIKALEEHATPSGRLGPQDIWAYIKDHMHAHDQTPLHVHGGRLDSMVIGVYPERRNLRPGDLPSAGGVPPAPTVFNQTGQRVGTQYNAAENQTIHTTHQSGGINFGMPKSVRLALLTSMICTLPPPPRPGNRLSSEMEPRPPGNRSGKYSPLRGNRSRALPRGRQRSTRHWYSV